MQSFSDNVDIINSLTIRNHHNFNKNLVFVNKNSFLQNKKIRENLRKYVLTCMDNKVDTLTCIGGESYMFGLVSNVKKVYTYTNSETIYDDIVFNDQFYKKMTTIFTIDYNKKHRFNQTDLIICNVGSLNLKLLESMNISLSKKIIIINCHADEFWNRKNMLTNYILRSRKLFLSDRFFVSVNIFELKEFVPIGNTCAIAYNLKRLNLRNNAYPFDWCKMNTNKFITVLNNDFDGFEDVIVKKLSENHKHFEDENFPSLILKNKYGIEFAHEVLSDNDIEEFKTKLKYRIDRFKKLDNCIFVVFNCSSLELLKEALSSRFQRFEIRNVIRNSFKFNDWKFEDVSWLDQLKQ